MQVGVSVKGLKDSVEGIMREGCGGSTESECGREGGKEFSSWAPSKEAMQINARGPRYCGRGSNRSQRTNAGGCACALARRST